MSNDNEQLLSALMDGELENGEDHAIQSISNNDEASKTWQRYHLIRDSLQGNLPESIDYNLANNIHQAIHEEPTVLAPKHSNKQPILKPVVGFAIAASVTAAVLLGVQNFQVTGSGIPEIPVVANQPIAEAALVQPVTLSNQNNQQVVSPNLENIPSNARMNRYLMNYNEHRASSTVQGMPPYVRMIGYEAE